MPSEDSNESRFGLLRAPTAVLFGFGQRHAVGHIAAQSGQRALICTDQRLAATPEFREIIQSLTAATVVVDVFDDVQPEVPTGGITACVEAMGDHGIDVVIGIGGGSCIDHAKVVAVLLTHGGDVSDYYGEFKVPGPSIPVLAMPTTAGTGSEVTPVAVIADPGRAMKVGIASPFLIPHAALIDPHFGICCPSSVTAHTAADALSHCVESFTALKRGTGAYLAADTVFIGKNIFSDMYALTGMRMIARSMVTATRQGSDPGAREDMQLAALCGGMALGSAGTAAAHAIQYPIGTLTHTAHGAGVGALLPYVMAYNLPVRRAEFGQINDALADGGTSTEEPDPAVRAVRSVASLLRAAGIPRTLAELGMAAASIRVVAEQAMTVTRLVANNPRPIDSHAMLRIVTAAYDGDLDALLEESSHYPGEGDG